jgi:FkbM family methyltransferase
LILINVTQTLNWLRQYFGPGDTYIDVGANIGHLAIEAALIVGPTGRVTAFEASPRIAYFLRENILLNKIPNIRVVQAAVGPTNGWVSFSDERSDELNSVIEHGEIEGPLITLDTLLDSTSATLIKIDVEGFEKYVLTGAKSLLAKTSFIYFEAWDRHFRKYEYGFSDIYDLLSDLNFEIITLPPSLKKLSRATAIPNCVNLLAFRDFSTLSNRTGWDLNDV